MIDVVTLRKPNSFGGATHEIILDTYFKIVINEDLNGNLIIDNYRRGIFRDKLLYSFTHLKKWEIVVPIMIEKMRDFSNKFEKVKFTNGYWEEIKDLCFRAFVNYK